MAEAGGFVLASGFLFCDRNMVGCILRGRLGVRRGVCCNILFRFGVWAEMVYYVFGRWVGAFLRGVMCWPGKGG